MGAEKIGNMGEKICLAITGTVVALSLIIGLMAHSLHHIDEGHVGVYFKYGALGNSVGHPGLNTMTPWVSTYEQITVRPIKDIVNSFSAVTKDAIQIHFHDVEVISSVPQEHVLWLVKKFGVNFRTVLVFDRLREEVKKYAFSHDIDANYQRVKVEWTEKLVAEKEQEKIQVRKETEELKAIADANRLKAVKKIDIEKQILQKEAEKNIWKIDVEKQILQKEAEKNISAIENERYRLEEENKANVLKYKKEKEAEGNKLVFTDEYLKIHMSQVFSNNSKLYFSG